MILRIIAALSTVACMAVAEDSKVYDSSRDKALPESEYRFELHQRAEGETPEAPPEVPTIELMTQPCMGWHFQAGMGVYNPDANRELLLLTSAAEVFASLVMACPADGANVSYPIEGATGAWAMAPMKGDRVAVGTYFDGAIHVFGLYQGEFTDTIPIPGESYVWNLVEGGDGRLYGGTFPGGKLIALNQDTLEIEDCGQAAPPNRFLNRVSALPDGRLLCNAGTEAPAVRIYDPVTRTFLDAPQSLASVAEGVSWGRYFVTANAILDETFQALDAPPVPGLPDSGEGWSYLPALTSRRTLFLQKGAALYQYDEGAAAAVLISDFDLKNSRLLAPSALGGVLGVRGQQYFHLKPGDTSLNRQHLRTASPPRVPTFLRTDASGQVWGAPATGQTAFFMDGKTGVYVSLGSVTPELGGVADIAFMGDVAYGASFPGGLVFRMNIQEGWDEWGGKNPQALCRMQDKGYQRPTGGILVSPTNRLYSGWSARAGAYGGAIVITDPQTGQSRLFENPLGDQAISGLAQDGEFLFAGTTLKAEGMPAREGKSAQFGVFGLETVQAYWNHAFESATTVDRLLFLPESRRVAMTVDDTLHFFDVAGMSLLPPSEPALPGVTGGSLVLRGDGCIYYGSGTSLIRLQPASGAWEKVLELPAPIGPLAADGRGTIFAACGVDVYRVRFPENYPAPSPKTQP